MLEENRVDDRISVIVPVYQVEAYLERCIDSILKQTYQNLEIILVDDGSTDRCPEICDKYAKKDPRIKVIHKENGGLSSARNAGLDVAEGNLIAFIDSDDYIEAEMIEQLYCALSENQADMAVCSLRYVEENHSKSRTQPMRTVEYECMDQWSYWEKVVGSDNSRFVVAWNKLYTKKLWEGLRYPVGRLNEDEFVLHDIISQCSKIVSVSYVGYNYVQRRGSIVAQSRREAGFDVFCAWEGRIRYFQSAGREDLCRKQLLPYARELICRYHLCRMPKDKKEFRRHYAHYQALYKQYVGGGTATFKEKLMKTGMEKAPHLICIAMRIYSFLWMKGRVWKSMAGQE